MSKDKKKPNHQPSSSKPVSANRHQNTQPRWKQTQKRGPTYLSTPEPVSAPALEKPPAPDTKPIVIPEPVAAIAEAAPEPLSTPTPTEAAPAATTPMATPEADLAMAPMTTPEAEVPQDSQGTDTPQDVQEAPAKPDSPAEPVIETLEQFIAYAYTLKKTQKLTLDAKTAKVLNTHPVLDADARQRLQRLAQQDRLLTTPRQLLRILRTATSIDPAVRNTLREFVRRTLLGHRLFQELNLKNCIQNQPEAPSLGSALSLIAKSPLAATLPADEDGELPDKKVFEELRLNAIRTLALWMADVQHTPAARLTEALYYALWQPAVEGGRVVDEHQILIEMKDFQSLGLACRSFVKIAAEKEQAAQEAARKTRRAQEETKALRDELNAAHTARSELEQRLAEVEGQLQDQQAAYQTLDLHLRDQLETLRTRVLRRLKDDEQLLSEGLIALRRPTPKIHVMDDHAERVLDSLHNEIKKLEGEG